MGRTARLSPFEPLAFEDVDILALVNALSRSLTVLAAISLIALGASGCGDEETTSTVTETVESSSTTSTTDSTVTESTGATTTTPDVDGQNPADQTVRKLTGFTSPSGNIGCVIDPRSVRCDIRDRDWQPPKAPPGCQLDFGQGISLDAGSTPNFVCAGDTTLESGSELPYGTSIGAGLLRCESEESGITCTDSESGRGFTISQQSYDLF